MRVVRVWVAERPLRSLPLPLPLPFEDLEGVPENLAAWALRDLGVAMVEEGDTPAPWARILERRCVIALGVQSMERYKLV